MDQATQLIRRLLDLVSDLNRRVVQARRSDPRVEMAYAIEIHAPAPNTPPQRGALAVRLSICRTSGHGAEPAYPVEDAFSLTLDEGRASGLTVEREGVRYKLPDVTLDADGADGLYRLVQRFCKEVLPEVSGGS